MDDQIVGQVDGRLTVVEAADAFFVAREEDPKDWLVRFEKGSGFDARNWAENMVRVYNRRLSRGSHAPPTPPGTRPGSYEPDASE